MLRMSKVYVSDLSLRLSRSADGPDEIEMDTSRPQEASCKAHIPTEMDHISRLMTASSQRESPATQCWVPCTCNSAGRSIQHAIPETRNVRARKPRLDLGSLEEETQQFKYLEVLEKPTSLFDLEMSEFCLNYSFDYTPCRTVKVASAQTDGCSCFSHQLEASIQSVVFRDLEGKFTSIRIDGQFENPEGHIGISVEITDADGLRYYGTSVVTVTACRDIRVISHLKVKCTFHNHRVRLEGSLAWRVPRPISISHHNLTDKESIRNQLYTQKTMLEKNVREQKKSEDRMQRNYVDATLRVSKLKKKILENQKYGGKTGRDSTLNGGDQNTGNGRSTCDGDLLPESNLEVQLLHSRAERAEIWRYYHNEKNIRQKNENHLQLLNSMYNCINQTADIASDGSDSLSLDADHDSRDPNSILASAVICPICNLTLKYI